MMSDNLQLFKLFIIVLIFKYEDDDEQWWSDEVMMMIKANMLFCAYKHDKLNYENEFKASSTVVTPVPDAQECEKIQTLENVQPILPMVLNSETRPSYCPIA